MLTKNRYSTKEMLRWTPKETIGYVPLMILITALIDFFDITFLHVPWTPVAIILAAIGFIIRFQNSAAYGRVSEVRKIWCGVVNNSKTFAMKFMNMVTKEYAEEVIAEDELHECKRTKDLSASFHFKIKK
jgi:putative membrane protein|tara:strand:+ start:344 stop:733 length:390 start_codon:yes stop_codon:yes gene_type:complete